jgi:hypothetical protein
LLAYFLGLWPDAESDFAVGRDGIESKKLKASVLSIAIHDALFGISDDTMNLSALLVDSEIEKSRDNKSGSLHGWNGAACFNDFAVTKEGRDRK